MLACGHEASQHLLAFFHACMATNKSGHPESNQGPSDLCKLYSQMLYQLSYSRLATTHRTPSEKILNGQLARASGSGKLAA